MISDKPDGLIKMMSTQNSWKTLLITLFDLQLQLLSKALINLQRRIFFALFLWVLGVFLIAISLVSFAVLIFHIGWPMYPIQSLAGISFVYGIAGIMTIRQCTARIS
ncbi:hypothetical protein [Limnohabitans sp. MORI2]|uniref:hypothetical protein n=1 Tax=Limnohabitans sp. MORI2 TaxID=1751150 RepID=UPI002491B3FE|nr:hypothetical protein [Limnohabitans sp. MORI2]